MSELRRELKAVLEDSGNSKITDLKGPKSNQLWPWVVVAAAFPGNLEAMHGLRTQGLTEQDGASA